MTELSTVPDLPYDPGALEPHISARITELHHDKHHAAYVKGANADPEEILSGFGSGGSRPACGDVPPPTTLPKPKSCPEGVDSLNAAIAGATNTSDIDASRALQSFKLCDGPEEWKIYAKVDEIGTKIGNLGDMSGRPLDTDTALGFLCSRYDATNSTDTCKQR